eukprot:3562348-Amphidinium_carterae.1
MVTVSLCGADAVALNDGVVPSRQLSRSRDTELLAPQVLSSCCFCMELLAVLWRLSWVHAEALCCPRIDLLKSTVPCLQSGSSAANCRDFGG